MTRCAFSEKKRKKNWLGGGFRLSELLEKRKEKDSNVFLFLGLLLFILPRNKRCYNLKESTS